ncbi:RPS22A ribosomal protein, putative, partial [Rhizoctonia solani AG-3 Rhs1AP]
MSQLIPIRTKEHSTERLCFCPAPAFGPSPVAIERVHPCPCPDRHDTHSELVDVYLLLFSIPPPSHLLDLKTVRVSVLNDCLNNIVNAERRGKRQVLIRPSSKVIVKFLSAMQRHGYIGEFERIDDHRSGKIVVQLNGRLNKTGVISLRFNVQVNQIESWVKLLLPARAFGIIILVR